ncbi:MAG: condensation domain-containing protein, partial [Polyangia bacterium]
MSLSELLHELRTRGVELRAEGGRLRCVAPPGALTSELHDAIRAHKQAILDVLGEAARPVPTTDASGIPRVAERRRYGLSITQQRAVVSAREGGVLPTAFRLRGQLDRVGLEATLQSIVARHAPLRSRFDLAHDPPLQEVQAEVRADIGHSDLSLLPAEKREAQLRAVVAKERALPFDVARGPLFRFHLIRVAELEHVLFLAFSPLVFDGWSFDILWNELRLGYAALSRGEPWPLPELTVEYADYVAWQTARLAQRDGQLSRFWRDRLGDELPPLPLSTERPRPRSPLTRGGSIPFELPAALEARLRAMARAQEATPQMTMLAGLYVFLYLAGGQERIIIGTPVEARPEPALEKMIGPCVNMLLLPARVDRQESFASFLRRLRDECLTAYEHHELPIER